MIAAEEKSHADKERARLLALELGLALERRDTSVEAVDRYGNREVISTSTHPNQVWQEALGAVQEKIGVKKSTEANPGTYSELLIYTDGGSRQNPGPSASGYVIYDSEGILLEEGGEYLGITTNNQAEYQALKLALEKAKSLTNQRVIVRMDSLLVVNQMKGIYKVRNRDLWPVHNSIKALLPAYKEVKFEHVPRERNTAADALVNKILDSHAAL